MPSTHSSRKIARIALALIAGSSIVVSAVGITAAAGEAFDAEEAYVVEVLLPDRDELDRLVGYGVDLEHSIEQGEDGTLIAQAVVNASDVAALHAVGFQTGGILWRASDSKKVLAEQEAVEAAEEAELEAAFAELEALAEPLDTDAVVIMRTDWFTTGPTNKVLYVEARSSAGTTTSTILTLCWDAGPGTAIGDGGCDPMSRFQDASQYLYHYETRNVTALDVMPTAVSVTSSEGGSATAAVTEWLASDPPSPRASKYQSDFITGYMNPTELYAAYDALAAEFPDLVEVIDLPSLTNGYRRHAQATLWGGNPGSSVSGGSSVQARSVVITSNVYGHEGGNDLSVELLNPGAADSPLSVSVAGNLITVHLGTDAGGALTSTALDVVTAINGSTAASALIYAHTYRGNGGAGIVAAQAATALSDFLLAPPEISREPYQTKAYKIGKPSGAQKMGVLAYAQEHAREWVPPLVVLETTNRLLRNYGSDGETKQLLNDIDFFVIPSLNVDGGHYSFFNASQQRKNMTNHCADNQSDPATRNSWGVDNNRNYDYGSRFDGFDGASASCTSGTFSGPAELSEPENQNLTWLVDNNPQIRFSMNLHSSGNYFMWSPGAYSLPGRITLERPTVGEEAFFWAASSRILTEIKQHRNLAVTPQRTGPICDVLYSAAGNSGDRLWYVNRIFAWNFEVGTSFQPNWTEAHNETMEFSNGLLELVRIARDYGKDSQRPETKLTSTDNGDGTASFTWARTEPVTIFYTLDGTRPTFASEQISSGGIRLLDVPITVSETTKVNWFAIDSAGNIENNYDPSGNAQNFNKGVVKVGG
jgi:hypothetical protein